MELKKEFCLRENRAELNEVKVCKFLPDSAGFVGEKIVPYRVSASEKCRE